MFRRMERERRRIIKSIVQLSWFMRGGLQYPDMMRTSPIERELVNEFIVERLESEGKKMYPVY